jgi:hypothetical protein
MTDSSSSSVASSARVWRFVQVSSSEFNRLLGNWTTEALLLCRSPARPAADRNRARFSVDPYLKIQQSRRRDSWQAPQPIGIVQSAFAIGRVLESSCCRTSRSAPTCAPTRAGVSVPYVNVSRMPKCCPIVAAARSPSSTSLARSAWSVARLGSASAHVFEPIAHWRDCVCHGRRGRRRLARRAAAEKARLLRGRQRRLRRQVRAAAFARLRRRAQLQDDADRCVSMSTRCATRLAVARSI